MNRGNFYYYFRIKNDVGIPILPDICTLLNLHMPESRVSSLRFEADGSWLPFPAWTEFFYSAGQWVAREQSEHHRVVVAISLPVRTYAAVFAAFGIVSEFAGRAFANSDENDLFDYLLEVPAGDAGVILQRDGRELVGVVEGALPTKEGKWLRVKIEEGENSAAWLYVRRSEAASIRLADVDYKSLPSQQKGRVISRSSKFSRVVLRELDFVDFDRQNLEDCVVVGRKSNLKEELLDNKVRAGRDSAAAIGCLQDVIRLNAFRVPTGSPRTGLCRVTKGPDKSNCNDGPGITIFDGALGFTRWSDRFLDCHWIVLLDQNELNIDVGVEAINQRYVSDRVEFACDREFPKVPDGIDVSIFWEMKK